MGRLAFSREEDRILDEIRRDDEYMVQVRVKHDNLLRREGGGGGRQRCAPRTRRVPKRARTDEEYMYGLNDHKASTLRDSASEVDSEDDDNGVTLTDAEKDLAILAQESMYLRKDARSNFQYIEHFASQELKQLTRALPQKHRRKMIVLVKKEKKSAFDRLKDRTKKKLLQDGHYAQQVRNRLVEALGDTKAASIIHLPNAVTPSPKKQPPKAHHRFRAPTSRLSSSSIPAPNHQVASHTHQLTEYEIETIQLGEESRIANKDNSTYNWEYSEYYVARMNV